MIPIISIVGRSNSGKTSLLERLIPELKGRGYRLAVIKHTREDFTADQPGKDSARLAQAGSDVVVLSSPRKFALTKLVEHEPTIEELSLVAGSDFDLILTEGFKEGDALKIEVHRRGLGEALMCPPRDLLAVVTDEPLDITVPQYHPDNFRELADLIEQRFLSHRRKEDLAVFINRNAISLNPFVKELITRVLIGIVSTLKGGEDIKRLDIWLKRES